MKALYFLPVLFMSSFVSAMTVDTKVCTVLHEKKTSQCVTVEKQNFPTTKLIAVTKIRKGERVEVLTHTWNGVTAVDIVSLESGRIIISTYNVPQGHAGQVNFSATTGSGTIVTTKTLEVARGPLSLSANEVIIAAPAVVEEIKPITAKDLRKPEPVVVVAVQKTTETVVVAKVPAKKEKELPSLDHLESNSAAAEISALAKQGNLPDTTDEDLEESKNAVEAGPHRERREEVRSHSHKIHTQEDRGLIWRRFEFHGAFVTQSKKGSSYSVIPYYAPEYRTDSFFGFGGRIGGTEFKQEKGSNITAIESDLHLSFSARSDKGRFTLQPAVGYHAWSKFGNNTSYGGNFEIKSNDIPLSILGGVQMWTYKKIDYRLVTIGLGVEF